ncbi:hypothetical protein [Pseudomonas sp. MWU13-2100]|uniref:hypothetical protein n=1 Tax=Pseudomonas sp. MWU13-2100 TaxID=2935075 RepID=UPI00200E97EE|nr:hypothetical protein [Pseudomonas sp. MWU13-2100]
MSTSTEELRELLTRIHKGLTDITGADVPVFERLLTLRWAYFDEEVQDGYQGACSTKEGDIQILTGPLYEQADLGSSNDR